jgi:RHS repeat-associated protein
MATAAASLLDAETFSASSERDALGRVLTAISPDGSEVHYGYDEGGALQQMTLHHRGSLTEQTVVGDITYDAKGRREEVVYGPTGDPTSTTTYTYDELSQRLTRLRTVRDSDSAAIQSLHYHYDPVGNITDIRDTAQQTVYFDNTVVAAANSYTYDALYRLVEATGREHSSEGVAQRTHADMTATAQPMTSDPSAMRLYTQQYVYDEVGNILEMKHLPSSGTGWTRYYQYDVDGNRLEATSASGDDPEGPYTHEYDYDDHGNMVAMPHLSSMIWNHDDELQEVTAGTETVYFQYAGGNRSRKYVEKPLATTEERIYLGNFEIYRKRISSAITIERESLHISDGTGRILLVETKTIDSGPVTTPVGIWRYQLSNHIGSASTEITDEGDIIGYEEYHPYGTTAYRAVDSSIDVSAKRYRYTGMERDEETGLSYHTARYYASWLGRWTAADPIGLDGGENRFAYVLPVSASDPAGTAPPSSGPTPVPVHTAPVLDYLKPVLDPNQYDEGKKVVVTKGPVPLGSHALTTDNGSAPATTTIDPSIDITTAKGAGILLHELFHAAFLDSTLPSDIMARLSATATNLSKEVVAPVAQYGDKSSLPGETNLLPVQAYLYVSEIAGNYIEARAIANVDYQLAVLDIQERGERGEFNAPTQELLLRQAARSHNEQVANAEADTQGYVMLSNSTGNGTGRYQILDPRASAEVEAEVRTTIDDYINEMPKVQEFTTAQLR